MLDTKNNLYSAIEVQRLVAQDSGHVYGQYPLDASVAVLENGMCAVIDFEAARDAKYDDLYASGLKGTVKLPGATPVATQLVGLVYSAEELYDERVQNLKSFAMVHRGNPTGKAGNVSELGFPRLYRMFKGDVFTTDAVKSADNVAGSVGKYFVAGTDGKWTLTATGGTTKPTDKGPVLFAEAYVTMPDMRTKGLRFIVVSE